VDNAFEPRCGKALKEPDNDQYKRCSKRSPEAIYGNDRHQEASRDGKQNRLKRHMQGPVRLQQRILPGCGVKQEVSIA
jgi:hypothetical protein